MDTLQASDRRLVLTGIRDSTIDKSAESLDKAFDIARGEYEICAVLAAD